MPKTNGRGTTWVMFLVLGLMLNTLGISLRSIGGFRFLLMALGLAFLLAAVMLTLADARRGDRGES